MEPAGCGVAEFRERGGGLQELQRAEQEQQALLSAIRVEDMPESFRILPEQGADWDAIIAAAKALPGVSNVVDQRCLTQGDAEAADGRGCAFLGHGW